MTGIYLTADLHLGHQKLAELRGFDSVARHDRAILLSHFPYGGRDHTSEARYQQWRLPDRGAPLVHGHTHQSEPWSPKYKGQVCVSWEAWNQPARLDEVVQLLKEDGVLS